MNVKQLLLSFPTHDVDGILVPCDNFTDLRPVHGVPVRELLAIYILYDYKEKRVFLPQTLFDYCAIPLSLNEEYESILVPFLNKLTYEKRYFEGSTYTHYQDEMKDLWNDLKEGETNMQRGRCAFFCGRSTAYCFVKKLTLQRRSWRQLQHCAKNSTLHILGLCFFNVCILYVQLKKIF